MKIILKPTLSPSAKKKNTEHSNKSDVNELEKVLKLKFFLPTGVPYLLHRQNSDREANVDIMMFPCSNNNVVLCL